MADLTKRRLTSEEWAQARRRWEGSIVFGFGWLAGEIRAAWEVDISRQAVSKMAGKCAWTKGEASSEPLPKQARPGEKVAAIEPRFAQPGKVATAPQVAQPERPKAKPQKEKTEIEEFAIQPVELPQGVKPIGYSGLGRPTTYRIEYAEMLVRFFDVKPFEKVQVQGKLGKTRVELVPGVFPMLGRFAHKIGVSIQSLHNWLGALDDEGRPRHPEFLDAYARAKGLQEALLVEGTMAGAFDGRFAPFLAKNLLGWKDRTEVAHEFPPVSKDELDRDFVQVMDLAHKRQAAVLAERRALRDDAGYEDV